MKKIEEILSIPGLVLLEPTIHSDERGFFLESYRKPLYEEMGVFPTFVQDNLVSSKKHTLRGMHYQEGQGQHKLISVVQGEIFDVAVDIRRDSPTFGKWDGVLLDDHKRRQFFVPAGFAHGYLVLSDSAIVQYKVSPVYDHELEKGFLWNDPKVAIDWPVKDCIISDRDRNAPTFDEALSRQMEF